VGVDGHSFSSHRAEELDHFSTWCGYNGLRIQYEMNRRGALILTLTLTPQPLRTIRLPKRQRSNLQKILEVVLTAV